MLPQNALGGFFELELPGTGNYYHKKAVALSNGRSCFRLILQETRASKVYVPFYTCDSLLEPLQKLGIEYEFYAINPNFEPVTTPELGEGELFVYINYFGTQNKQVNKLLDLYADKLVIDDTQAFFERGYSAGWSFNSARKFFGVPDGGYLYTKHPVNATYPRNSNYITDHLILRLDGKQKEAFQQYQQNERLQTCEPASISILSERILSGIHYGQVGEIRKHNFSVYAAYLDADNSIKITQGDAVPFCYPLLLPEPIGLAELYKRAIFIPVLWKDVLERKDERYAFENLLSSQMLILPVDQRLDENDIMFIINTLTKYR